MRDELFSGFSETGWDEAPWDAVPTFTPDELQILLNPTLLPRPPIAWAAPSTTFYGCVERPENSVRAEQATGRGHEVGKWRGSKDTGVSYLTGGGFADYKASANRPRRVLGQCGLLAGQTLFGVLPPLVWITQNQARDVGEPDDATAGAPSCRRGFRCQ